jgi:hypothetical protein
MKPLDPQPRTSLSGCILGIQNDLIQSPAADTGQQITSDPDIRDDLIQPMNSSLPVILKRYDPTSGSQITCDPDIRDDLIQPQDHRIPVILISRMI